MDPEAVGYCITSSSGRYSVIRSKNYKRLIDRALEWANDGDTLTVVNMNTNQQLVQFTVHK